MVFCVCVSANAVCTEDLGGYAGSNYQAPIKDQNFVDLEPVAGLPLENQTADGPMNIIGNETNHVSGNVTGNATDNNTGNNMGNNTGNNTNITGNATTHNHANVTSSYHLLSAGNPLITLISVIILVGSFAVIRRNR